MSPSASAQAASEKLEAASNAELAFQLERWVHQRRSIVVCGLTESDKYATLAALVALVPQDERVAFISDRLWTNTHERLVKLTSPPPAPKYFNSNPADGAYIDQRDLLSFAQRYRADRIAIDDLETRCVARWLVSLNSGNAAGMASLYAPDAQQVVERMREQAMADDKLGLSLEIANSLMGASLDLILVLRDKQIASVHQLLGREDGPPILRELYGRTPRGEMRHKADFVG